MDATSKNLDDSTLVNFGNWIFSIKWIISSGNISSIHPGKLDRRFNWIFFSEHSIKTTIKSWGSLL